MYNRKWQDSHQNGYIIISGCRTFSQPPGHTHTVITSSSLWSETHKFAVRSSTPYVTGHTCSSRETSIFQFSRPYLYFRLSLLIVIARKHFLRAHRDQKTTQICRRCVCVIIRVSNIILITELLHGVLCRQMSASGMSCELGAGAR